MSGPPADTKSRIAINRWNNGYVVDAGQLEGSKATADVFRRIDQSVAKDLAQSCAQSFARRAVHTDQGVWRIRKLHLDFTVDMSSSSASDLAQVWAESIAQRIAEIVDQHVESDNVLHFDSHSVYLANFVLDLAAGRAWQRWYYDEFRSLEHLAAGRGIAEALTREPKEGMLAIFHLAEIRHLDEVLSALTESDAQLICDLCFIPTSSSTPPSPATQAPSQWAGRLLEVWRDEPDGCAATERQTFHDALRWMASAAVRYPELQADSAVTYATAQEMLELRRVLAEMRSQLAADRLVRALTSNRMGIEEASQTASNLGAQSPEAGLRFLVNVAGGDADWASQMTAVLLKDQAPSATAVVLSRQASEHFITTFGGVFLLGTALASLNQIVIEAAGYSEEPQDVAGYLRFLTLAKCVEFSRQRESTSDAALRLLSSCSSSDLRFGLHEFSSFDANRALLIFAGDLPALAGCDGELILAEVVRLPHLAADVMLLHDVARDEWIHAAVLPRDVATREQLLISKIEVVREATGNKPHLLLHPSIAGLSHSTTLQHHVSSLHALDAGSIASEVSEALARAGCPHLNVSGNKFASLLETSGAELDSLLFNSAWPEFDLCADLFSALLARSILRGFTRRLMGFQSSSLQYLKENFLEGIGSVYVDQGRIEVQLPRGPLLLILQLSGLARQSYTVPWLEEREICLLPPPE